jgi:hypothetical protein
VIVPPALAIGTSSILRIRRSDNLQRLPLAILIELMRVSPRSGALFMPLIE